MKRVISVVAAAVAFAALPVASGIGASENGEAHSKAVAAKQCAAQKKADRAAFNATYGEHAMRNCIRGTTDEVAADHEAAAEQCRAEREADPAAFQATYGTNSPDGEHSNGAQRNAMGKCVSATARAESEDEVSDFESAADQCRAQREADPEGFTETWGTNSPNGENSRGARRNAFGKCVSATAKASD